MVSAWEGAFLGVPLGSHFQYQKVSGFNYGQKTAY